MAAIRPQSLQFDLHVPLTLSAAWRCRLLSEACPVINLPTLIDDTECFPTVRDLRWPDGVTCPHCASQHVVKDGKDEILSHRQRYDLSGLRAALR